MQQQNIGGEKTFTGVLFSKSLKWALTWVPVYKLFKNVRPTNAHLTSKRYLLLYFIWLSSLNLPSLLTKSALASCFSMSSNRNLASHIGHYCWLELLEQAGVNILNFSKIINTHQLELTSKQSKGQILYLLSFQE